MERRKNWNPEWNDRHTEWQKENTVIFSIRLFKSTDADILAALDGKQKATEIKRLARLGMKFDSQHEADVYQELMLRVKAGELRLSLNDTAQ